MLGEKVLLHTLLKLSLADNEIEDSEVDRIRGIYQQFTGETLDSEAIDVAVTDVIRLSSGVPSMLAAAKDDLAAEEKELIILACLAVAAADDHVADDEKAMIISFGEALGLPSDQVSALVNRG